MYDRNADFENLCEKIDSHCFTGDTLFDPKMLEMFEDYIGRWTRAIQSQKEINADAKWEEDQPADPVIPEDHSITLYATFVTQMSSVPIQNRVMFRGESMNELLEAIKYTAEMCVKELACDGWEFVLDQTVIKHIPNGDSVEADYKVTMYVSRKQI